MKKPECIPDLYKANYTMVRSLGYEPLTKKIDTNFGEYVNTFILGTETNNEEDFESVEDIIERLYKIDSEKCLQVIDKEHVIWEKLEYCCAVGLQDDNEKLIILEIWNHLLKQNRTIPSWENYITYRDEFGIKPELINYLDTQMEEFIIASDKDIVSDDIIKEILIDENISLHSFKIFIQEFRLGEFTNNLNEFDENKVKAMIDVQYFPFSSERYTELRKVYPDQCIEFICKNKQEFMETIDACGLTEDEVVKLLKIDSFSADEKIKILNQIESGVYRQLAKRTRHKVSFHDDSAGYNKRLLNYLDKIDYLSSIKEEDSVVGEDEKTHKKKVERMITGRVKQAND